MAIDPLKAQGYRTQRAELPEDLWQPMYDRANYAAAGSTEIGFFSTPRGQSATLITAGNSGVAKVKSYRDTNNENANVVPTKMFKIVGMSIAIVHNTYTAATNADDRSKVKDGSYFQFRIVDKDVLFLPTIFIPEVNPLMAVSTTVTATTVNSATTGGGNASMYKFPIPITINPYENFSLSMKFDGTITVTNTLDIYVVLHAYMRRPT